MSRVLIGLAFLLPTLAISWGASAQSTNNRVVAVVGEASISVADAELGLRRLPSFQLRMLAKDATGIRRAFVDQLVQTALFAEAAKADQLNARADVRERIMSVLVSVVRSDIRKKASKAVNVSAENVADYYAAHSESYASQLRLELWRIQLPSKQAAQQALEAITKDPRYAKEPIKVWGDYARKHSLDKVNAMRNGKLGFVSSNGGTVHKGVRVDPVLYQAALTVKDGQMVPEPVADGSLWSLVQRRGTMKTPERSLAAETGRIRSELTDRAITKHVNAAIADLRKNYVSVWQPEALDQIEGTRVGDIVKRRRQGTLPRRRKHPSRPGRPKGPAGQLR